MAPVTAVHVTSMLKPSVERTAARPVGAGGVAGGLLPSSSLQAAKANGQEHHRGGAEPAQGERHQFLIEEGLGIGDRSALLGKQHR